MTNEIEIKNAKIDFTKLGIKDHGIMTFSLGLNYGNSGQTAGGYCLSSYDKNGKIRKESLFGIAIIGKILEVIEVNRWENLVGTLIRVKADHKKVHSIGHYLKDKWLDFEEFANEFKEYHE